MRPKPIVLTLVALAAGLALGFLLGRGGGPGAEPVAGAAEAAEAAAGSATSVASGAPAGAQASGVSRTILRTIDDPGGPTHEVVMGIAEIPVGASAGRHTHPGIEVGYVLEGTMRFEHEGREPEILTAGGSFDNNGVHDAINAGGGPLRILAVWIVEKGQPMASPAP